MNEEEGFDPNMKFVETVLIDDDVHAQREGTLQEIAQIRRSNAPAHPHPNWRIRAAKKPAAKAGDKPAAELLDELDELLDKPLSNDTKKKMADEAKDAKDGKGGNFLADVVKAGSGGEVKAWTEAGKLAMKAIGAVWNVLKDSKASADAKNQVWSVVAEGDATPFHYRGGKKVRSKKVSCELKNFAGVQCYKLVFQVEAEINAYHGELPGIWIPAINLSFHDVKANWPWQVNADAKLDLEHLVNRGSAEIPIPEVRLAVLMNADAKAGVVFQHEAPNFYFDINAVSGIEIVT
jgi:hypothetical protein